jgi:hypothetical protein
MWAQNGTLARFAQLKNAEYYKQAVFHGLAVIEWIVV